MIQSFVHSAHAELPDNFISNFPYTITQTADGRYDHLLFCFPFIVDYTSIRQGEFVQLKPITKLFEASNTKGASEEQMINGFNNREAHKVTIIINKLRVKKFTLDFQLT